MKVNNKMLKLISSLFIIALIVSTILSPNVSYAENESEQNYEEVMNDVTEITDNDEKKKFKEFTKQGIKNKKITLYNEKIDYDNARLYKVNETNLKAYTVQLKGSDQKFHEISNVTIFYDGEQNISEYTEFHLKESEQGTFQITYYSNGQEIGNEITDDTFTTAKEHQKSLASAPGFQTMGMDWGGLADCLGISWSVGAAIAVVCGGVCLITAGAGCGVCIGAYLGYDLAAVSGCVIGNFD